MTRKQYLKESRKLVNSWAKRNGRKLPLRDQRDWRPRFGTIIPDGNSLSGQVLRSYEQSYQILKELLG